MADKTVGTVSVRVVPDTSKFRDEAKAKLAAEQAKLHDLKVGIILDEKGFTSQVRAATDAAQRAVKDINVGLNLDRNGLAGVNDALRQITVARIANIGLSVDASGAARAREALDRLQKDFSNINVGLAINGDNAEKVRQALQDHLRDVEIQAELDKASEEAVKEQIKRAAEEAGRQAQLQLKVNEENLKNLRDGLKRAISDAAQEQKLTIQLDETRTAQQLKNLEKRLEEVYGKAKIGKLPIEVVFDPTSRDSIAKTYRELENTIQQLGSKVPISDIANEIIGSIQQQMPEDPTIQIGAEAKIRDLRAVQAQMERFWADLKKQELENKIQVGFELEEAALKAEVNKVKAELAAEAVDLAIKAKFEYDRNAWKAQIAQAESEAKARLAAITADLAIRPAPETVNKAIDELKALILKRGDLETKLKAELDGASFAKLEAELAAVNGKIGDITATVRPEISQTHSRLVSIALAILTRARDVEIKPVLAKGALSALNIVSVLSGFDALKGSIIEAHEALFSLFTDMPKLMQVVPAVLAMSGAFLTAAGNLAGLAASAAQALPILLAIPGIAIGLIATVVAFKDMGKVLPDVVAQFKALGPLISSNFWGAAKGPIQDLANTVFPQLQAGLASTAQALGGFFGALATSISTVLGNNVLAGWFAQLTQSIQIFTGFTPQLAGIFKLFGDIGSTLLAPLAFYVGSLADRFQGWIQGLVDAAGGVQGFADQTLGAFEGIVETVISLGGILGGVFSAALAAGAASFQSLADHLNTFAAIIKDPAMQQALTGLFQSAFQMMDQFFSAAGPAFQALFTSLSTVLTTMLPQVGGVLAQLAGIVASIFSDPAVTAGLQVFVDGILTGVQSILPALQPLGDLIAALGPTLGLLATTIGNAFAALAPQIGEVVTSLAPLITMFGSALASALTTLSPLITVIIGALNSILAQLAPLLQPIIDALLMVVSAIVPPLMSMIQAIVPPLLAIVGAILPPLAAVIAAIAPVLAQIIGVVAAALVPILTILAPILAQIAGLFGQLLTALLPIISVFAELIGALLPPLIEIIQVLLTVAMVPLQFMVQGLVVVLQILGDILTWVVEQVIIPYVIPFIQYVADLIAGTLIPIFQLIGTVFKATWDFVMQIWDAFKKLFSGDVKGFITDIVSAYESFKNKIIDAVKGAFESAWNNAKAAMDKLTTSVGDAIVNVLKFFADLPGKVTSSLGNLGTLLLNAGKQLLQGFLDGILSMWDKIKDKLSALTDLLPSWKGPASKDKVLLYDAGQLVMDGFLKGLESRYDAVRESLQAFSADVAGTQFASPTIGVSAAAFTAAEGGSGGNTFIYNAAPGSSLGAEEDLFSALGRGRAFGGW